MLCDTNLWLPYACAQTCIYLYMQMYGPRMWTFKHAHLLIHTIDTELMQWPFGSEQLTFRISQLLWRCGPCYLFSISILILSPSLPPSSQHLANSTPFPMPLTSLGARVLKIWLWLWPKEALSLACVHPMYGACSFLFRRQVVRRIRAYILRPSLNAAPLV